MKRGLRLHGHVVAELPDTLQRRSPFTDGAHTARPTAMERIGLGLHKRESQLPIKAEHGTIADRRIVTSRERLTTMPEGRLRARILLEASTESERVARHLESVDRDVIVADPNNAPMYANGSPRTKTNKRDARTPLGANS